MSSHVFFFISCLVLIQNVYSQVLGPAGYGYGPGIGPGISPSVGPIGPYGAGYGPGIGLAPALECAAAYGGAGVGDVAVVGEIPVAGTTLVAGQVPILGAVRFAGDLPAAGVVTIAGSCACGCGAPGPYYY